MDTMRPGKEAEPVAENQANNENGDVNKWASAAVAATKAQPSVKIP